MNNPALGQHLKVLFLCGVGLIIAIILGWNIGSENYILLLLGAAGLVVVCIALFSRRLYWVITIASSFLGGMFPILGAKFTPFQVLMAVGVVKFLVEDVVLRRQTIKASNRFDLLMLVGFMAILTWHGVHDRFGMRFLGSSVWGGHNYVNVYVGLAAFFVVQSIPMKLDVWKRLPYWVLAVTSFDLFIAIITTLWPGLIWVIYPFYSAVSALGLEEIISGQSDVTQRIGAFGNFGFVLIAVVFASVSLRKILHPAYFFRFIAVLVGCATVLYSGFRSAVLNTLILAVVAGIRDFKVWVLWLLPFFVALLLSLSFVNAQLFHLPRQVQRGLAFLPGDWDVDMAQDATASNEFRQTIWNLWTRDYFPQHPLIGRGFGFKSEWTKQSVYYRTAVDYQQTVETGNLHNGFFASIDALGIVGTIFFLIWNFRLLLQTFRVSFRAGQEAGVALRFVALYLAVSIITFWFGAQNIGSFLPQQFALAGVFIALRRAVASASGGKQPVAPRPQNIRPEFVPA